MPAREGDFRPRTGGPTKEPENVLAGVAQPHESLRQQEVRTIFPMTFDFTEDTFADFAPVPVDSADVEPRELLEPQPDPKDLSALESVISSELPTETESESSASPVNLVHAARDSTPPRGGANGTPISLPPPSPGQSALPAGT